VAIRPPSWTSASASTCTSGMKGMPQLDVRSTRAFECQLSELTRVCSFERDRGMVGSIRKTRAEKKSSRHARREEENSLELSQLDLQVLERLRQGKTYKTIAHELNMSASTLELHIRHTLERIDARDRAELLSLIRRPQ
jgi:DNA-binding CsgD family transcriptional regulator